MRAALIPVCCLLACLGLALIGLDSSIAADVAPHGDIANPHGAADQCAACHDPTTHGEATEATCRGCHPTANMHPVGVHPASTRIPEGWPLDDGAVSCATCHAEPACDPARSRVAPYLRGGPAEPVTAFCARCHTGTGLQRVDPHHPATPRDESDPSCGACHEVAPPRGAPPAESRLRADPSDVCAVCHEAEPHAGLAQHLGALVPAEVRSELPDALPLDEGRIRCWTCHDTHAGGEIGDTSRVGPRARRDAEHLRALLDQNPPPASGHPAMLALPLDASLCRACHGALP